MFPYTFIDRNLDRLEESLIKLRLFRSAGWDKARSARRLYAGKLRRGLPQYKTHIGLTPFQTTRRNIDHDVSQPMPLATVIDIYQSEDVFEHLPYESLGAVLDNIYSALAPGGLLRLSMPDYRCDLYADRCLREDGEIVFDPGGGGIYREGKVRDGGHLWFPTYESTVALFEASKFETWTVLEGYHPEGDRIMKEIDYSLGFISRTSAHDLRVRSDPRPLSIVIDARKGEG